MKKSSLVHPQIYLYQLIDKVANCTLGVFTFKSDAECVRSLFPTYYPIMPLRDMEIRKIGFIDSVNTLICKSYELVSWDCYKLPESHAENLKEIGMTDEQVKELFKKRIEQSPKSALTSETSPKLDIEDSIHQNSLSEDYDNKIFN